MVTQNWQDEKRLTALEMVHTIRGYKASRAGGMLPFYGLTALTTITFPRCVDSNDRVTLCTWRVRNTNPSELCMLRVRICSSMGEDSTPVCRHIDMMAFRRPGRTSSLKIYSAVNKLYFHPIRCHGSHPQLFTRLQDTGIKAVCPLKINVEWVIHFYMIKS